MMAATIDLVCSACGRPTSGVSRTTRRCDDCATVNAPRRPFTVDPWVRYADDPRAQRFVAEHPDGADLRDIGAALGVSHQRIAQIEVVALKRLAKRLKVAGVRAEEAVAYLMRDERPRAMGGGMHLALVHPVRESSVRELVPSPSSDAPAASWSVSAKRWGSLARVQLGFEAELGQRLEAALRLVEERVEVLELVDVGLRRSVDTLVAELPDGVRAPAIAPLEIAPLTSMSSLERHDDAVPAETLVELAADTVRSPAPRWEAFGSPPVAAAAEEEAMGSRPVFYDYEGKQLRAAELAALPQAVKAGLDRNCIHLRLQGGWPIELAISSPKGTPRPDARSSSKPPPAPKTTPAKKRSAPKPQPSLADGATITATASLIDPVSLLERLGVAHELVGRTPRGRLVLFVEAADAR